ncbi:UbiA family prenyltransferase [Nitrospinota bacterium]
MAVVPKINLYFTAIRVQQWLKNLLIFVPLIAVYDPSDILKIQNAFLAFFSFSFCASGIYILNDIIDLQSDRTHPTKKRRPLAAGDMPLQHGLFLAPLLIIASYGIAFFLPPKFVAVISVYFVLTMLYSFRMKKIAILDVMALAGFYTLRIIGGTAAISVEPSFLLLAYSMFIFLSLALVKRCSELKMHEELGGNVINSNNYRPPDREYLQTIGILCGLISVLLMAFYINSPEIVARYSHPRVLWGICVLLFYWVAWIWLNLVRGEIYDDPFVFILKDNTSRLIVGALGICFFLAI